MIKKLMITGSSKHPEINDDWVTAIDLDATREYSSDELISIAVGVNPGYEACAMWVYEGDDYEDKTHPRELASGTVTYGLAFHPWDTSNVSLVKEASSVSGDDDFAETWQREVAMEAGMMGGCDAYNEVMGF